MKDFSTEIFTLLNKEKRLVILRDKPVDVNDIMIKWLTTKMTNEEHTRVAYFDSYLHHTINQIQKQLEPEDIKSDDLFRLELTNGSIILDKITYEQEHIKPDIIVFDGIQDSEELSQLFWKLRDYICDEKTTVIFIGYGDYYGTSVHEENHMFADIYWSGRDAYGNNYTKVRVVREREDGVLLLDS